MIELKTPREIEEMKPAGRFVGGILKELKENTKVGTNLLEIDEFVHKKIVDMKAPRRSALTCPRGMAATGNSLTATESPLSRASCSVKPTWASGGAMKSVVA